jgi:hypothetical protein
MRAIFVIFKVIAQSCQPFIGRKIAQSGHPGFWQRFIIGTETWFSVLQLNAASRREVLGGTDKVEAKVS